MMVREYTRADVIQKAHERPTKSRDREDVRLKKM